ncbi:MAG: DUF3987 domain-containing protein [Puniceicoccales bacterium]|jgi:hypothetical protein|nr:DUF3987 domain-containing protein [Puniceicoccales bacterium]
MKPYDRDALRQGIKVLRQNKPFEVRILGAENDHGGRSQNLSGYFDSADDLLPVLDGLHLRNYRGIYLTQNDLKDGIVARGRNKIGTQIKATADADILRRRWLFIDIDPKRPSGVSATDGEKAHAKAIADLVVDLTKRNGWTEPVIADSGNGYHLFYAIDLEPQSPIVAAILKALAARFDNEHATIDTSVANPSRIIKIPGTWARKGDDDKRSGRIHRMGKILSFPEEIETIAEESLTNLLHSLEDGQNFAGMPTERGGESAPSSPRESVDLDGMTSHLMRYFALPEGVRPETYKDGWRWSLLVCPFDGDHGRSASVFFVDGKWGFHCHHASCRDRHWQDVVDLLQLPLGIFSNAICGVNASTNEKKKGTENFFAKLEPLPPVPMDIFEQDCLNDLVEAIANVLTVPAEMVLLSMATLLGFSLGSRLAISPKRGVFARQNLFSWVFMGAGERKSTTYAALIPPIMAWNQKWLASNASSIINENGTQEGQLAMLRKNHGILGIFSDDARAGLQVLDGRYSDGQSCEGDAVKCYDGNCSISIARKIGGDFQIDNPCMSRLEMVQPDWVQKIGQRSNFFDSGFLSRTIVCIPDPMAGTRNTDGSLKRAFNRFEIPFCLEEFWGMLNTKCLNLFVGSTTAANCTQRILIPLSGAALERWIAYYNRCEGDLLKMKERERSFAVRYPTTVLRIALLRVGLRAAEMAGEPLPADPSTLDFGAATAEDIEAGIRFIEYFRHHHGRFLAAIDDAAPPSLSGHILDLIRRKRGCTTRDLQRSMRDVKMKEIVAACEKLERRPWIQKLPTPKHCGAGRPPSPVYVAIGENGTGPHEGP